MGSVLKQFLRAVLLASIMVVMMTDGALAAPRTGRAFARYDLRRAFEGAVGAEVIVARPDLETPSGMDPIALIGLGCHYFVRRGTAAWDVLEREVADTIGDIDAAQGEGDEIRLGLVLRSRTRTVAELFSASSSRDHEGFVGFLDGQRVRLPRAFASALARFAARFPDLAIVDQRRPELCVR